VIRSFFISSAC